MGVYTYISKSVIVQYQFEYSDLLKPCRVISARIHLNGRRQELMAEADDSPRCCNSSGSDEVCRRTEPDVYYKKNDQPLIEIELSSRNG